jgi:hypothetical protein
MVPSTIYVTFFIFSDGRGFRYFRSGFFANILTYVRQKIVRRGLLENQLQL